jgi:hypothetical protein
VVIKEYLPFSFAVANSLIMANSSNIPFLFEEKTTIKCSVRLAQCSRTHLLKRVCHEIFEFRFFFMNQVPIWGHLELLRESLYPTLQPVEEVVEFQVLPPFNFFNFLHSRIFLPF